MAAADGKVTVADATAVTVYVSAATDYKNTFYDETGTDDYYYRTGETDAELQARVKADVDAAVKKGYEAVKETHLADYQEMFNRVDLQLGQTVSEKQQTSFLRLTRMVQQAKLKNVSWKLCYSSTEDI